MLGILLYDDSQKRFVIQELIDGVVIEESRTIDLHCGNTLSICVRQDDWQNTRIEKDSEDDLFGWYFVGLGRSAPLVGHSAKI